MSVVIRLDTAALQYLFEKFGDEFVLELKSAVLKNALKAHIGTVVEDEVKREIEKLVIEAVKTHVAEKPWDTFPTLRDSLRDRIASKVSGEVHDVIWDTIHKIDVEEVINKSVAAWDKAVRHRVYLTMRDVVQEWAKEEVARQLAMLKDD